MNEKQMNEIAEGIMSKDIAAQCALNSKRKESKNREQLQRKMAIGGLIGLGIGLAVGHFCFDSLMPAGLFGALSGMTSMRFLDQR